MGAWGNESCANDSCWDRLGNYGYGIDDIHEVAQEQDKLNAGLAQHQQELDQSEAATDFITIAKHGIRYEYTDLLGCVVWGLTHGCKIDVEHLERALLIARSCLTEVEASNPSEWREPDKRADCLREEITEMEAAIKADGQGQERHVKGLMERMCDPDEADENGMINK